MKEENCVLHKMKRGILWKTALAAAALLVFALLLLDLPSRAAAEVIESGICGDTAVNGGNDVTWSLDGNGTLTISGSGRMQDYEQEEDVPWHEKRRDIKSAVIGVDVTSVGSYAFKNCLNLKSMELKVTSIGTEAFRNCTNAVIYYPSGCTLGTDALSNAIAGIAYTVTDGNTGLEITASNGVGITIPATVGGGTVKVVRRDAFPRLSITHAGAHSYADGVCTVCGELLGDVVEVSPENFPDEIFRNYVSENFDTDGDGCLNQYEIGGIININVGGKGISSLQGIEFFTALQDLVFGPGSIETLDISQNTELVYISGNGNKLTTLDVSKNTKLKKLVLQSNPIQSLDVSNNPLLELLWLGKLQSVSLT